MVQQFGRGEADAHHRSQDADVKGVRAPAGRFIGQQDQAGHRALELLEDAVVVCQHAARQRFVVLGLDFDMHQDPLLLAAAQGDGDQLVGQPAFGAVAKADLGELLVEETHRLAPVDLRVQVGEIEGHEGAEAVRQHFFPW